MQRVSDIVGKPIVSAENGERVGKVADLLVDREGEHIIGVVVREGFLSRERVLLYSEVQAIGEDAVIARSDVGVIGPKEWRQRGNHAARSSTFKDKRVITDKGRRLGSIKDVYVDEQTGVVEGFEVTGRALGGLMQRRGMLPRSHGVTVGRDAVIVSDEDASSYAPEGSHDADYPRRD